jgi:hypothetical protein
VDLHDDEGDAHRQQGKIDDRPEKNGGGVAPLQRVEDRSVPQVHPIGGRQAQENGEQNRSREHPAQPISPSAPKAQRALPKSPQQEMPSQSIRVILVLLRSAGRPIEVLGTCQVDGRVSQG